jgi:hypothetical protein
MSYFLLSPTMLFPSVNIFALACFLASWKIEKYENYQKRGGRNSFQLPGPNGIQKLSIPLIKGKNNQQAITDTIISFNEPWQSHFVKSIKNIYSNAPFYDYYSEIVLTSVFHNSTKLYEYNIKQILLINKILKLNIQILETDEFIKTAPKQCVDVRFSKSNNVSNYYPQVFEDKTGFLHGMSILDLLFCMGPRSRDYLFELGESLLEEH